MDDMQIQGPAPQNGASMEPPFSEEEQEILDLYDQVQKLELELALSKARVRLAGIQVPDALETVSKAKTKSIY